MPGTPLPAIYYAMSTSDWWSRQGLSRIYVQPGEGMVVEG